MFMSKAIRIKEWMAEGNLIFFAGILLAFVLPFGKAYVPPFIGLFVLSVIISPGFGRISLKGITRNYLIFFTFFYVLHIIGLIWTGNMKYAFSDLEIKLSMLIIPLVFLFSPGKYFNAGFIRGISVSFFIGCFVSLLISGFFALNLYNETGDICSFYYSTSSYFMHTSYISLYIVFALYALYTHKFKHSATFYVLCIMAVFLIFYLNLLSSKAGFMTFALAMVIILIEILLKRKWNKLIVTFVIPAVVFAGSLYFFPVSASRVLRAVDTLGNSDSESFKKGESTADRVLIWKAALELSKENVFIGTGTGDIKDELIKTYKKKGLVYPVQFNLNAHNQFLQSFIALGALAVILLLTILIIPLWLSFRKRKWLYFAFICFFTFNILVESMLEVQAGIVFFTFFNIILWIDLNNNPE